MVVDSLQYRCRFWGHCKLSPGGFLGWAPQKLLKFLVEVSRGFLVEVLRLSRILGHLTMNWMGL